jgi:Tfp pilus assembly protein PilN
MKIRFNLLPENQKEHLRMQKNLRTIMEQEIHVLIIVGILVLSLFAIFFLLKTEAMIMKDVEDEIMQKSGYGEVLQIHDKFKETHEKMNTVNVLEKKSVKWSRFFHILSENIDQAIRIDSLKITDGHAVIEGVADTREDVVSLKEKIAQITQNEKKCFDKIAVPEAQLAVPVNVKFTISFNIDLTCLE